MSRKIIGTSLGPRPAVMVSTESYWAMLDSLQRDADALLAQSSIVLERASIISSNIIFKQKVMALFVSLEKQLGLLGLGLKVYQAELISKYDDQKNGPYAEALANPGIL
ncbi:MAG: hypothetical protein WC838_01910, partial [Candidatus Margulisiibacteriota bacterium]